jgi:MFS family permease
MLSLAVLRQRNFRLLLLTRMGGAFALQCQGIIVGWQIYSLTRDPLMLGLTGLAEAVPALLCALVAGHVVDINPPKRVFACCLGVLALNTLMLLLVGGAFVAAPGGILPWIFSGVFISGVARAFIMPSNFSMLALMVPRKDIAAASAWLSSGFQVAAIGGPAIAGIIYGGYGARIAWVLPFLAITLSFFLILFAKVPPRKAAEKREPALQSIAAGWKFIFSSKILLPVMALDMLAVLFGGVIAMLPAYADEVLHVGSEGLGILRAAPAVGAIVTALLMAARPMKTVPAQRLLWAVAGFGVAIIAFGLSKSFLFSVVCLAASGAFDSISMIVRGTLMQLSVPDRMQGRVSAVNSMFIISSNEIGAFESGVAAKLLGLVPSIVLGGIGTLLVVGMTALLAPAMRRTVVSPDDHPGGA